jgi:hypothetical protein
LHKKMHTLNVDKIDSWIKHMKLNDLTFVVEKHT